MLVVLEWYLVDQAEFKMIGPSNRASSEVARIGLSGHGAVHVILEWS